MRSKSYQFGHWFCIVSAVVAMLLEADAIYVVMFIVMAALYGVTSEIMKALGK